MRKIESLREHFVQRAVERARGGEIAPERLLDDHARVRGATRAAARFATTTGNMLGGIAR